MEKKKISLFDISVEHQNLVNEIINAEGELTPEMEQALALNEKNRNQKAVAYLSVFGNSDGQIAMATEIKKRAEAVIKREKLKQERMKALLLNSVKTFGDFQVGVTKFLTRKSNVIIVDDVNTLPEKYRTKKVTITADKAALKDALNDGKKIKGVRIQENRNLSIK